jgi:predicted TIM-barrel fold metal-dependent hydrolase
MLNKIEVGRMKVIDIHHHFVSKNTVESWKKLYGPEAEENYKKSDPEGFKKLIEIQEPVPRAELLIKQMKDFGIDMMLPMAFKFDVDGSFEVHRKFPDRFPGVIPFLEPESHPDPEIMEEWVKKGAVSVKLHPGTWEKYRLSSPELLPYFKKMVELNINPIIHVGVIKGGSSGLWPAHPDEIRPWITNKELNSLKFTFAHFGAGYLSDILIMSYGFKKRIFLDTSGSNDWIFSSHWENLTQVFEKSIRALSSSNIMFGTDSNFEAFRPEIILRQKGILQDLVTRKVIGTEDQEKILSKNTIEMFNLKI